MSEIHVVQESHEWEVWFCSEACIAGDAPRTETSPRFFVHDGIVIGVGPTRDEALASAEQNLEAMLVKLGKMLSTKDHSRRLVDAIEESAT